MWAHGQTASGTSRGDDSITLTYCYHAGVRQLLTRIDDDLHARLKERARREGVSVNALVTGWLKAAVGEDGGLGEVRARASRLGLAAEVHAPPAAPSLDEVLALTAGAGTAVSDALAAERAAR